jgi:predicted RecA/RadA family phage recombinase
MATNMLYKDGRHLKLAIASISSGDPVAVGEITGVALIDTDADGNVVVDTKGVYDLSVKGIDGTGDSAVAIGDKLYYSSGDTPKINKKNATIFFGYALEAIASGATDTIMVLLK